LSRHESAHLEIRRRRCGDNLVINIFGDNDQRRKMGGLPMFRLAAVFFIAMASTAMAQTNRTELKRADLTGTDKEIIIAILEVPPGSSIAKHTHPGEEAVYVLEGATLQMPDGKEITRPAGQAGVNVRDVPHAGYKVIGDKTLKLLTVHIVDKGKPMTVPAN
jgi:quercetin dioxygenase-like cupin family protein